MHGPGTAEDPEALAEPPVGSPGPAGGALEPTLSELQAALERHVDERGGVLAREAHRLAMEEGWSGRLVEVLGLLAESDQRMSYLAGGRRPEEVSTWVSLWADSPLSLENMRLIMASGGWDPEPFVVLVNAGLLDSLLRAPDGSARRVRGELAGAWVSDELALSDDAEIVRRARDVLAE